MNTSFSLWVVSIANSLNDYATIISIHRDRDSVAGNGSGFDSCGLYWYIMQSTTDLTEFSAYSRVFTVGVKGIWIRAIPLQFQEVIGSICRAVSRNLHTGVNG